MTERKATQSKLSRPNHDQTLHPTKVMYCKAKDENEEEKGRAIGDPHRESLATSCWNQILRSSVSRNLHPTLILGSILLYAKFYWKNCPIELRHSETKTRKNSRLPVFGESFLHKHRGKVSNPTTENGQHC